MILFICVLMFSGKPDLFIAMTCNPDWDEITDSLLPGQQAWERPDLTARVFELKFKRLISEIVDRRRFGRVIGYVGVIEFQKRGLPHAHLLVILAPESKPRSADAFDKFTCAELPTKDNVVLHSKVLVGAASHIRLTGLSDAV